MKTRDIKELQTKSKAELQTMLKEMQVSFTSASLEHAQRKLTNTTSLTMIRHDIARVKTAIQGKMSTPEPVAEEKPAKVTKAKGGK